MDVSKIRTLYSPLYNQVLTSLKYGPASNIARLAERAGQPKPVVEAILRDLRKQDMVLRKSRGWVLPPEGERRLSEARPSCDRHPRIGPLKPLSRYGVWERRGPLSSPWVRWVPSTT